MENKKVDFIVMDHPPWYWTYNHTAVFRCESTQGLYDKVTSLMLRMQNELSEREKRFKPINSYKTIKDMVICAAETIAQKPSPLLLLALMDLVDITGGNDFDSVESVDRAGVKHLMLAHGNYTSFYVPNKELHSTDGKKVIPVITQYSEHHNFYYCDIRRSMIGTYIVALPSTGDGEKALLTTVECSKEAYFTQEVLFVPGHESLELLKTITGNKFNFWDMSLEVPTHTTALTPSFQHIQPFQLLRAEDRSPSTTQCNKDELKAITPMCCVLDTASAETLLKKREGSIDCFTEQQVKCDLKHFHYKNGGRPTVYFRRSGKRVDGKRLNLIPVVSLRMCQIETPELYVSTTVRFCRAVKRVCVKGNRELVSCWNGTLQEMDRDTFITGPDMCQDIHAHALTAFIKRVTPNSLCNYIPKQVESMIRHPIMVEVVELAIGLMDSRIPNAFAVAELLYCPIEKVQEYVKFWNVYLSDKRVHAAVRKCRVSMSERQMKMNWTELARVASMYVQKRYSKDEKSKMVSACEDMFKHQTLDNLANVQKMWQALVKHDTSKIKDKDLIRLYGITKVLFLKLRTHHNKLKKGLMVREESRSGSSSPDNTQDGDVPSNGRAEDDEVKDRRGENAPTAGVSDKGDSLYDIVIPDNSQSLAWISKMSALLLCEPWLNDEPLRREAVCTLLGLDNTLLHSRYKDLLCEWVKTNRNVVRILQKYGLQDRLSKALTDCLECMSTDNWRHKVMLTQGSARAQLTDRMDQLVSNLSKEPNASTQSNRGDLRTKKAGKCARTKAPFQHPKEVELERAASRSNTSETSEASGSNSAKKRRDSRASISPRRCSKDDDEYPWLSEAEEVNDYQESDVDDENELEIIGEDLETTKKYDDNESLDEYSYSDGFVDDRPTTDGTGEKLFCAQVRRRTKMAMRKIKRFVRGRRHWSVSHSESEQEETKHSCGSVERDTQRCKRVLQSDDSDSELITPDVKRVKLTKCTKENRLSDNNNKKNTTRIRSITVAKEKCVQRIDRDDKTNQRQDGSDKSCRKIKPANVVKDPNSNSLDDFKGEGRCGVTVKEVSASSKSKGAPSFVSDTYPGQEARKKFLTKTERSGSRKQREHSDIPATHSSHRTPDVSQHQGTRFGVESSSTSVTGQAAWLNDTLHHQDSSDHSSSDQTSSDHSSSDESSSEQELSDRDERGQWDREEDSRLDRETYSKDAALACDYTINDSPAGSGFSNPGTGFSNPETHFDSEGDNSVCM